MKVHSPYSRENLAPARLLSHLIAITSQSGVGSSTTLKNLCSRIGDRSWRFVSGGDLMRREATRRGMSLESLLDIALNRPQDGIDRQLDNWLGEIGRQNHTVLESRLAHLHCRNGFRVLLTCPYEVRAVRKNCPSRALKERDKNDHARYSRLYPGSMWPEEDFDLVLSTEKLDEESIVTRILAGHEKWRRELDQERVVHAPTLIELVA